METWSIAMARAQDDRSTWYEVRDGRRHVVPYTHSFASNAKGRWVGKRVFDVMQCEMLCTTEYLQEAAAAGRLTLNGQPCGPEAVFRHGDKLVHVVIRTEPSVPAAPINLLLEAEDLLVLHKPAGVPVHHAGRYRRNTVVEILQHERPELELGGGGRGGLHVLHRLDRQVSGVLLLPRTPAAASQLGAAMEGGGMRKQYLARVAGCLRAGATLTVTAPIRVTSASGVTTCDCHPEGKSAETHLRALGYDAASDTSLVLCEPFTGRTHQIRLHLLRVGHPIANDPTYRLEPRLDTGAADAAHDARTRKRPRCAEVRRLEAGDAFTAADGECEDKDEDELWLHAWSYACASNERNFAVTAPEPGWAAPFATLRPPEALGEQPVLLSTDLGCAHPCRHASCQPSVATLGRHYHCHRRYRTTNHHHHHNPPFTTTGHHHLTPAVNGHQQPRVSTTGFPFRLHDASRPSLLRQQLLRECTPADRAAYDLLWPHFERQRGLTMCGPASIAMVVRAAVSPGSRRSLQAAAAIARTAAACPATKSTASGEGHIDEDDVLYALDARAPATAADSRISRSKVRPARRSTDDTASGGVCLAANTCIPSPYATHAPSLPLLSHAAHTCISPPPEVCACGLSLPELGRILRSLGLDAGSPTPGPSNATTHCTADATTPGTADATTYRIADAATPGSADATTHCIADADATATAFARTQMPVAAGRHGTWHAHGECASVHVCGDEGGAWSALEDGRAAALLQLQAELRAAPQRFALLNFHLVHLRRLPSHPRYRARVAQELCLGTDHHLPRTTRPFHFSPRQHRVKHTLPTQPSPPPPYPRTRPIASLAGRPRPPPLWWSLLSARRLPCAL